MWAGLVGWPGTACLHGAPPAATGGRRRFGRRPVRQFGEEEDLKEEEGSGAVGCASDIPQ